MVILRRGYELERITDKHGSKTDQEDGSESG